MKEMRPFVLRRCAVKASLLLLLAASSTVVFAQPGGDPPGVALNDITLVYRDWTGNLSATNRTWFYLDENGDEETTGYGIYPAIELDFLDENREGWPAVPGVVYKSDTGLAHIQIKFQNTNEFAVTGTFEVIGIRMRAPTNDPLLGVHRPAVQHRKRLCLDGSERRDPSAHLRTCRFPRVRLAWTV